MNQVEVTTFWGRLGRAIRRHFLTGLVVLVPVAAAIWVLWWLFSAVDGILRPLFRHVGFDWPGLGFIAVILIVYIVGVLASTGWRRLIDRGRDMLSRVPLAGTVYGTVRDIANNTIGGQNVRFNRVVLVDNTGKGVRSIGFVTGEFAGATGEALLNVYVPGSPLPTSGSLFIVRAADCVNTSLSIEEAMKIITSAGMVTGTGLGK